MCAIFYVPVSFCWHEICWNWSFHARCHNVTNWINFWYELAILIHFINTFALASAFFPFSINIYEDSNFFFDEIQNKWTRPKIDWLHGVTFENWYAFMNAIMLFRWFDGATVRCFCGLRPFFKQTPNLKPNALRQCVPQN